LKQAGADKVYAETISGAITDRKQLAKAVDSLTCGDLLLVTRLDRLAGSTRDLLNILAEVSAKDAKFKSLADPWCDTSTPTGELMVTVLAGLATFERHSNRRRPGEG
jgi:DNA invertase Pin-like site-specific DNA recombinase